MVCRFAVSRGSRPEGLLSRGEVGFWEGRIRAGAFGLFRDLRERLKPGIGQAEEALLDFSERQAARLKALDGHQLEQMTTAVQGRSATQLGRYGHEARI